MTRQHIQLHSKFYVKAAAKQVFSQSLKLAANECACTELAAFSETHLNGVDNYNYCDKIKMIVKRVLHSGSNTSLILLANNLKPALWTAVGAFWYYKVIVL